MKRSIVVCFIFLQVIGLAQSKKQIKLKIEENSIYCGGAMPTEEIVNATKKLKPYAFKTIYVYKGAKCVDSLITDSAGCVNRKIKKGKYSLYLPYKHFKTVPYGTESEYHMDCMAKEWLMADGTLDVSKKGVVFVNHRIGRAICPWQYNCLKVRHLPPAAPGQN